MLLIFDIASYMYRETVPSYGIKIASYFRRCFQDRGDIFACFAVTFGDLDEPLKLGSHVGDIGYPNLACANKVTE